MIWDYARLTLARVATPHQALATQLRRLPGVVGQFAPQLGWANNEAAVLLRRRENEAPSAMAAPGLITCAEVQPLSATLRPSVDAAPRAGGIYVHRWFEVDADAADEFVQLSGQGWERFEDQFDTQIFGLFRAAPSAADRGAGLVRLLLLTRYADHGVWQASRDPTSEAMRLFQRRAQLTRRSWAASTTLIAGR